MGATATHRQVPAAAVLAAALACAPVLAAPGPLQASHDVIVSVPGGVAAAAAAVTRAGGRVLARLPLGGSVFARLPQNAVLPTSATVAADRRLTVAGLTADGTTGSTVRATLGMAESGNEGNGVTVAVVDTGVADVPGLAGAIAGRVDVTGDGGGDAYGHGTFMAGLVAGDATGVAPGARVLDVKVAGADGSTSLSLVLRGLEAVAARPDVRVVNLSLSSGSPLPWQVDPLTRALDALWRRGVVVVVPSGNDGPDARTVGSPGLDPNLLTAGGLDENGTADRADDTIASWSSRGPAAQNVAKPDLAAPGAHLVSLRAPGSTVDAANPAARVGTGYFRGSGTSMATAVTAGAVAALLAARPGLSPDAVKSLLVRTAYTAAGLADPDAAGAGGLDVAAAYDSRIRRDEPSRERPGGDADDATLAEFARAWAAGDYAAAARAWAALSPQTRAWAARAWAAMVWSRANSWSTDEWNARAWAARAWAARAWADGEWLARAWAARAWADEDWAARAWAARAWAGRAWAGRAWAGRAWAGRAWADEDWAARAWVGRAWADDEWSARAWSEDGWAARAWTGRAWAADEWSARAWSARAWTAAWDVV